VAWRGVGLVGRVPLNRPSSSAVFCRHRKSGVTESMYPFLQFAPFLHVLFNYIRSIFGVRTFSTTPDFCEFCRELSLESFQQPLVFSTSILQSTCPSCTLIRNVLTNDGTRPLSLYPDKLSMSLQNEKNYLRISITRMGGHSLNRISVDLELSSPSQRETFSVSGCTNGGFESGEGAIGGVCETPFLVFKNGLEEWREYKEAKGN
jgi:hypothetical protein